MLRLCATATARRGTGFWNGIVMVESSARRRILALWLPRLSTDRLQRRETASGRLDRRPLVIAAKIENALRLTAVDANAAGQGLTAGMALADARARIPELAV